jgi:hypothetical protein
MSLIYDDDAHINSNKPLIFSFTLDADYLEFVENASFPKYINKDEDSQPAFAVRMLRAVMGFIAELHEFREACYTVDSFDGTLDTDEAISSLSDLDAEMGDVLFWYANIQNCFSPIFVAAEETDVFNLFSFPSNLDEYLTEGKLAGWAEKLSRKLDEQSILKFSVHVAATADIIFENALETYSGCVSLSVGNTPENYIESLSASNRAKLEQRVQEQGSPV